VFESTFFANSIEQLNGSRTAIRGRD